MFKDGLKAPLFANIKITDIGRRFRLFRELGVFPEVYIDSDSLAAVSHAEIEELKSLFAQNAMLSTVHAPFWDLSLGSIDRGVRNLSVKRIVTSLNIAKSLNSKNVVFHSGYTETSYLSSPKADWNNRLFASLAEILDYAGSFGVRVSLENVYEPSPDIFIEACENFKKQHLGLCFDCGHFNVFAKTPLEDWLKAVAPYLRAIHVHSNHATADEHLAVDNGNIDFEKIFGILAEKKAAPLITIENKVDNYLVESVKILRSEKYFRILNSLMPDIA
jgi:sugar phosphate isomerase/epimerase